MCRVFGIGSCRNGKKGIILCQEDFVCGLKLRRDCDESVARIRLMKTENPSACGMVNYKVCRIAIVLYYLQSRTVWMYKVQFGGYGDVSEVFGVVFIIFLSLWSLMSDYYLKLGHDCFLPHSSPFIIRYHSSIHQRMSWVTDSIIREITNK
jgi:hypothetical protein